MIGVVDRDHDIRYIVDHGCDGHAGAGPGDAGGGIRIGSRHIHKVDDRIVLLLEFLDLRFADQLHLLR